MKKHWITPIFIIFTIFCMTISTTKAYSNVKENTALKCIAYNIWDLNNSEQEFFGQLIFEWPDTFYIGGEYLHDDVFLVRFNESQTSLEELNLSVYEWGGNNTDYFGKADIDSSGDIYITGSTLSFGAGNRDIFITKMDESGQSLWNRTWGYSYVDVIDSDFGGLAIDSEDNAYIAGVTAQSGISANVCLVKYDPFGEQLWNRTWGTENQEDRPKEIHIDEDDQIYISGVSYGVSSKHFLLKYDKLGNKTWETSWGVPMGLSPSYLEDFLFTGENIFLGETFQYSSSSELVLRQFNHSGDEIHNTKISTPGAYISFGGMIESSENKIIVYGRYYSEWPDTNPIIAEYDLQGNWTWISGVDNGGREDIHNIALDSSDNIYLCGGIGWEYDQDIYLLKFNNTGGYKWHHIWGAEEDDVALSLFLDDSGIIYTFGNTENSGTSIIIAKFEVMSDLQNPDFWPIIIIVSVSGIIGLVIVIMVLRYKNRQSRNL